MLLLSRLATLQTTPMARPRPRARLAVHHIASYPRLAPLTAQISWGAHRPCSSARLCAAFHILLLLLPRPPALLPLEPKTAPVLLPLAVFLFSSLSVPPRALLQLRRARLHRLASHPSSSSGPRTDSRCLLAPAPPHTSRPA
ncbi:hypothetical protein DFH09DRAFT_1377663 [Mycena vulgaris]|nr:hypothetical protein DFH09DRAFT_1377663 [Mycena vulgaris]